MVMLSLLMPAWASAAGVEVAVVDRDGNPVPEVAVYLSKSNVVSGPSTATAVMDQRDAQFVPHILVIQKGTTVEFPNSDVVAHHVYSFSKPNNFVLPLYKGNPNDPVTFDYDGIVTLGCNIHDHMLGYIVIVDTDVFGVTDENGTLNIDVNDTAGEVAVNIWSPRIRDKQLTRLVTGTSSTVTFALQKKLRPPHNSGTEAVEWSEY